MTASSLWRGVRAALALLVVVALMFVFMPVERVRAEEIPPKTESAEIDQIPVDVDRLDDERDVGTLDATEEDGDVAVEGEDDAVEGEDDAVGAEDDAVEAEDDADSSPATEADADVDEAREERSEVFEAPIAFTGMGMSGPGPDAPTIHWRALLEDGTWTDWHVVEALDAYDGPDPESVEARAATDLQDRWVSDAIWVGPATHLQIQVKDGRLSDLDVTVMDSAGLNESLVGKAARYLRSFGTPDAAEAFPGRPDIKTRSDWGANESCTSGTVSYAQPRATVLHHTATTNSYSRAQVPQQIRNMYHWHTACHGSGNGWNDIGYNFVVDRFGDIWEGRRGGVANGVIGAHAGGWNTNTFGVAIMGNYNTATPSSAALDSAAELIRWKYDVHGIDPSATATARLNGQTIPTLVGHRNVRGSYTRNPSTTTDCPGQRIYTRTSTLRADIASRSSAAFPVVGDWNANGRTTIGWFQDGVWRLRNSNSSGAASTSFHFGRQGDLPVVGDWNGDGRTTVGIVRDGQWHLRNSNSGGSADHVFWYGRGAIDFPMAGDWNANGKDTPAIVRDGEWHLRNSLSSGNGNIVFTYGRVTQGDIPIVGDWNSNGRDTPGILRDGEWHLRNRHSGGSADVLFTYGRVTQGDYPIVGDWNINGRTTPGVVRDDAWHLRNSLSNGPADVHFTFR